MKRRSSIILRAAFLLCVLGTAACLVLIGIKTAKAHLHLIPEKTEYAAKGTVFTPPSPVSDTGKGTIDINRDNAGRLALMPGIGESRAKDIIAYREDISPFFYPVDITCVSGIGDASFLKLEEYICLSEP